MIFGVGVSCRILYSIISYLYISCSGSITLVGDKELIYLLSFSCNYVVSVQRGFLFLWVLGMGCVILLWHTLSHPYNYFGFEDRTLVLIASLPGHCLPLTFLNVMIN